MKSLKIIAQVERIQTEVGIWPNFPSFKHDDYFADNMRIENPKIL